MAAEPESYDDHYERVTAEDYSWIIRAYWMVINHIHDDNCGNQTNGDTPTYTVPLPNGGGNAMAREMNAGTTSPAFFTLAGLVLLGRERNKRKSVA